VNFVVVLSLNCNCCCKCVWFVYFRFNMCPVSSWRSHLWYGYWGLHGQDLGLEGTNKRC